MFRAALRKPPALRKGSVVGIIAPSSCASAVYPNRLQFAVDQLAAALDVKVRVASTVYQSQAFCAGTAEQRAAALNDFLRDDEIDAVFCTIGGFNSTEMLPHLDWSLARRRARILVGYSDCTALLLAFHACADWVTFYGPAVMTQFGEFPHVFPYTLTHLERAVRGDMSGAELIDPAFWTSERLEWAENDWLTRARHPDGPGDRNVWQFGTGEGHLWGGNIETVNFLVGTPYLKMPGEIVLLWECTEAEAFLPRVQRALTHLEQYGVLARTKAMLVGRSPDAKPCMGATLREVVLAIMSRYDVPVIADLPFGHTDPIATLPIGTRVSVEASAEGSAIRFLEAAVR